MAERLALGSELQGSCLQINPPRSAVEADADRPAETRFIVREDSMKRRADVEPQFLARELGDVVGQRPAGRLQIAPGVLGQMHHPVGLVDDHARRRKAFQSFAMNSRLDRRAKSGRRSRRQRLKSKCPRRRSAA